MPITEGLNAILLATVLSWKELLIFFLWSTHSYALITSISDSDLIFPFQFFWYPFLSAQFPYPFGDWIFGFSQSQTWVFSSHLRAKSFQFSVDRIAFWWSPTLLRSFSLPLRPLLVSPRILTFIAIEPSTLPVLYPSGFRSFWFALI